ncbi:energy-coupling factor transporter transmembrane component T family protein [Haloglycomyces albus]|uniref:energy-coupling factor transporter transmembrane component T family protein n=1 Tax=Haloglycomyces albus TaxID=526067 RepID=UPI00046D29B0|nr:energy-coupling factor transporter transmembrane component T [Haloglycomyces albus]
MVTALPLCPPESLVARLNPLSKLIAAASVTLAAFLLDSWQELGLLLGFSLLLTAVSGVSWPRLAHRLLFFWSAAAMVVFINTVWAAEKTGQVWWTWGPITVASDALETGTVLGLRVAIAALVGLVGLTTTDPTDMADALMQQWRVSERFTIGALTALRMLPLLAEEWQRLSSARRARGLDGRGNPIRRVRLFASTMFGLLVIALRRGQRLALAVEARGFDPAVDRTYARRSRWHGRDWVLVAVVLVSLSTLLVVSSR